MNRNKESSLPGITSVPAAVALGISRDGGPPRAAPGIRPRSLRIFAVEIGQLRCAGTPWFV